MIQVYHSFWSKIPYIEIFHILSACSYFFFLFPAHHQKIFVRPLFDAANTSFNKIIHLILAVPKAGRCSSLTYRIPKLGCNKTLKSMNGTGNNTIIGLSVESVGIRIKQIIMNLNNFIGIVDFMSRLEKFLN